MSLCPLKRLSDEEAMRLERHCDGEGCAWWISRGGEEGCAIAYAAIYLSRIAERKP